MKSSVALVVLLLTVSQTHEERIANNFGQAMYEMREVFRNKNAGDILEGMTQSMSSMLPKELLGPDTVNIREFGKNFMRNVTNGGNIRQLMHLIRESPIPNKGEIIRMVMRFMNPENMKPEGLVRTLKELDSFTISELNVVYLKYFKYLEPKLFGHDFDGFLKYLNEDDIRDIYKVLFDIIKETDTEDLIWVAERLTELAGKLKEVMMTNGTTLMKNWEQVSEQTLRDNVTAIIADIQRLSMFETFSNHGSDLTEVFKRTTRHVLDNIFDDLKNSTADVQPKVIVEKISDTVKQVMDVAAGLLEIYDVNDLGTDVARGLDYLKSMNTSAAMTALQNMRKYLPRPEKIVDGIQKVNFIKTEDKAKIADLVTKIDKIQIPDSLIEKVVHIALSEVRKINTPTVKHFIEFWAKKNKIDNDVYLVLKEIAHNLLEDSRKFGLDVAGKSWDDLKSEVEEKLELIDGNVTEQWMHEAVIDIKHLNATAVADVVVRANKVMRELANDTLLLAALENPLKFFDALNRSVFADLVYLQLDALKVINVDDFTRRCHNVTALTGKDLKQHVANATQYVQHQFDRVANGSIAAEKLKLREIASMVGQFFEHVDLNDFCMDGSAWLRANRVFADREREEIVRVLWDGLLLIRNNITPEGIKKETATKLNEMMRALLHALTLTQKDQPINLRTAVLRLAVRQVADFSANQMNIDADHFDPIEDESFLLEQLKFFLTKPSRAPSAETTTDRTLTETAATTLRPLVKRTTESFGIFSTTALREHSRFYEYLTADEEDSLCKTHVNLLAEAAFGRNSSENWAVDMMDLWTPSIQKQENVTKQHCFAVKSIALNISGQFCKATWIQQGNFNDSAAEQYEICIPTSCSVSEWNTIVKNISNWQGLVIDMCTDKFDTEPTLWDSCSWILIIILLLFVTLCTIHDLKQCNSDKGICFNVATSFSLKRNVKKLFEPFPSEWPIGIDGIRVFGLAGVILHNTFEFSVLDKNLENHFYQDVRYVLVMYVAPLFDVLLFTTGLLVTWSFLTKIGKTTRYDVFGEPLRRIVNWAFCFLVVMLLRSGLLRSEDYDESVCKSSWWHHILFVSNFMEADHLCLPQAWYLSLEMQLICLSIFVLFLMYFAKNLRWIISLVLLITFTSVQFLVLSNLDSTTIYPQYGSEQFWAEFVKPYTRAVPWIFGIIVGFLIVKQKEYDFQLKLNPVKASIGMILSLGVCLACVYSAAAFLRPLTGKWQLPMYLAFTRLGFSLGLSIVVILCASGNGGWLAKLLSLDIFKIHNRVFFSTFLGQFLVVNLRLKHFSGVYTDDYSLIITFFGDLVASTIFGILFYLFVERPAANLLKSVTLPILPLPRSKIIERNIVTLESAVE